MQDITYPTRFYSGPQPQKGVGPQTRLQRNDVLWLDPKTLEAWVTRQGKPVRAQLDNDVTKISERWTIASEVLDPDQLAVAFARRYGTDVIPLGTTPEGLIRWQFCVHRH